MSYTDEDFELAIKRFEAFLKADETIKGFGSIKYPRNRQDEENSNKIDREYISNDIALKSIKYCYERKKKNV